MKRKKINKAIKTLKKFCKSQPNDCSMCPFRANHKGAFGCAFETLPVCWQTLRKVKQKAREEV